MITPILRIFDMEKAEEFYINFFGFKVDWIHQFEENMPKYLQISLNDVVIHLSEHHGDASPGSAIRIKVSDIKSFHTTLLQKEYPYAKPGLQKTPWNTMEVKVYDPFSNRLIFYEDIV
jgi:uncharacterized glyoxalase superfamily protein PhnB